MTQNSTVRYSMEKPPPAPASYGVTSLTEQLGKFSTALQNIGSEGWSINDMNLLSHTLGMANNADMQNVAWTMFRTLCNAAMTHTIEMNTTQNLQPTKKGNRR